MDGGQSIAHLLTPLVIVYDLDICRVTLFPIETDTPLVIDANAMLPLAITCKFLQAILW